MKSISIIGCGWFGLPLAEALVDDGFNVVGTKRNSESFSLLESKGITPVALDLSQMLNSSDDYSKNHLNDCATDYLLVNIPPRTRSGNKHYLEELELLLKLIKPLTYKRIIFISTSGVYPDLDRVVDEGDACQLSNGSELLYTAEQLFLKFENACLLRFSGLIGPKRNPGRFFANRDKVDDGNAPVNLVHLDDCIHAVKAVLKADSVSSIYNICSPHHPTKSEFYSEAIKRLGRVPPVFVSNSAIKKQVDGSLITRDIDFTYKFDNLYVAIEHC
ncbi:SDR family NAD(P)-dependent oxidoreductase [Shewanella sp. 202IG2-18]|uniref:SDR family NAD(P)-dependent oxidoreductase n=1 Tax=Parashewanella hymeniacidonis TaxID=2807618 RepID=UPI0019611879|nr:SDR family NAD(P)-dependent oxidoreductase [Parashewanella hymeniacidonis]MBM7072050.1 SDR family NAD(P)-dependent oxidoreductase [Parashewanella hymeniacidonis]